MPHSLFHSAPGARAAAYQRLMAAPPIRGQLATPQPRSLASRSDVLRAAWLAAFVGVALLALARPANATLGDAKLERDLIALTNVDRTSNSLAALIDNPQLVEVARERSDDMATQNYFA